MSTFARMKAKASFLATRYGMLGAVLWVIILAATTLVLLIGLEMGYEMPGGTTAGVGKVVAAYFAARLLFPLRLAIGVVVIPTAAWLRDRFWPATDAV